MGRHPRVRIFSVPTGNVVDNAVDLSRVFSVMVKAGSVSMWEVCLDVQWAFLYPRIFPARKVVRVGTKYLPHCAVSE
jgi:hypothetical protein